MITCKWVNANAFGVHHEDLDRFSPTDAFKNDRRRKNELLARHVGDKAEDLRFGLA